MLIISNRKASFDYEVLEKYSAGIVLFGYEVKAIKEKNVNFEGAFIQIINNEPFLVNMNVGRYSKQSQDVPETEMRRTRKLLLQDYEIGRLEKELAQKGKTVVPLALHLDHNLIKLELAIVKGRKKYEKRHVEKEKQIKKDMGMQWL